MGVAPLLVDERDRPLLHCAVVSTLLVPLGLGVYLSAPLGWPAFAIAVALHLGFYLWRIEPFVTFFHDVHHRRLFSRRYQLGNQLINWVLGSIWGSTPYTYLYHHVVMHHPTNNLDEDVSTTLPYQRDSLADFLRYYIRFFVCLLPVRSFLIRRYPRGREMARKLIAGELLWWAVVLGLAYVSPLATLVVFGVPLVLTRTLLIVGNWGEHAFIDPAEPENPFLNSTELLGPSNQRAFNVGYHCAHHLRPRAHYSEHPAWFEDNRATYGQHDAVVLRDLNYPQLWFLLVTHQYRRLARHFVALPGAPSRTEDEIVDLLRSRVRPIEATP